jgi:hypothetical protein
MAKFNVNKTTSENIITYYQTKTRLDRAITMFQNKVEVREVAPDTYLVASQKTPDKWYKVKWHTDQLLRSCECKDHEKRGAFYGYLCKHLQLVALEKTVRGQQVEKRPIETPQLHPECPAWETIC